MGQHAGVEEWEERMGQLLLQQQAAEPQQPLPWPFCASSETPGTRERRIESNKAQAFFVVFMPQFFYSK
jgi:hypothetical protein